MNEIKSAVIFVQTHKVVFAKKKVRIKYFY